MKFKIYQGSDGQYYWKLVAKNGLIIADGTEGYASAGNCRKALKRVIAAAPDAEIVRE